MKIKQVHISGFGKWSQVAFDFNSQLQIIVGQNESGKSTLRAFIVGILFGFPSKKQSKNVYDPQDGSRYGGDLVVETANGDFRIARFDRTQSTLTIIRLADQHEITNPEEWLSNELSPLTRQSFDDIFNFSEQDLIQMKQISAPDLQKLLLNLGAVGSTQWLEIATEFDKQADKLFASRATGRRSLNQAVHSYEVSETELAKQSEQLKIFLDDQQTASELTQSVAMLEKELDKSQENINQLTQLQRQYRLFYEAQQIERKQVRSVSESDLQHAEQLQVEIDLLASNIRRQEQDLSVQPESASEIEDSNKRLMTIKMMAGQLVKDQRQHDELLAQQKAIQAQFATNKVPELLTVDDDRRLSNYKVRFIGVASGAILLAIAVYLVVTPIWLWLMIVIVLLSFIIRFVVKNNSVIGDIKKQYYPLNDTQIRAVQPSIEHYLKLDNSLTTINQKIDLQTVHINKALQSLARDLNVALVSQAIHDSVDQLAQTIQNRDLLKQNENVLRKQQQSQLDNMIEASSISLNQKKLDLKVIFQKYDVEKMTDLQNLDVAYHEQMVNDHRYQAMIQQIPAQDQKKLSAFEDAQALSKKLENEHNNLAQIKQHFAEEQAKLARIQAQQMQRVSNDDFMVMQQKVADQKTELIAQFSEYLARKLANRWIYTALHAASQNRFPKMMKFATEYFSQLTVRRYQHINFEKDEIIVTTARHESFNVMSLSTGTQEQLYVAMRLALARVIADVINFPMVIDDGFVNFDPQRRAVMLDMLAQLSDKQQIIYLTTSVETNDFPNMIKL
ncbi:AAA family ATPase [Leuconostoc falkenbergense]|uniref:AAA family ATPase n=1 Tax=Leuconostoc falkenbergense TaxID=2766470 RepID=UPI0024A983C9|nr:AAA family ATPase [Leuconostoc falkenbergense]MDI6552371.1 AAA family ATPase [Leuconostoc falkenbergense]